MLLERRSDTAHITEEVLKAAASNERSGEDVMELLPDKRGEEVLITEEVPKAAARNEYWGHKMVALLLGWGGGAIQVTEEVLIGFIDDIINDILF